MRIILIRQSMQFFLLQWRYARKGTCQVAQGLYDPSLIRPLFLHNYNRLSGGVQAGSEWMKRLRRSFFTRNLAGSKTSEVLSGKVLRYNGIKNI